jgi:carboxyl-terminal processing protease
MNNNYKRILLFLPIILAVVLAGGIFIGKQMAPVGLVDLSAKRGLDVFSKLNQVMRYIEEDYVDTVNLEKISESAIEELLQSLDPHSYYIPVEDYNAVNDPLEGNFDGIGVEFRITDDTIMIVNPLGGGPSEKLGIMAGDRIIKVDTTVVAGVGVDNQMVMKLLKGPKGTKVNVGVLRPGNKNVIDFTITRDEIPLYSVESAYLLDNVTGYIKISRFAKNTHEEFLEAVSNLQENGMENIIVDLRNNGGGFLTSATRLADEFLPTNKMIVYTEGKSRPKQEFYATSNGELEETPVVILINEGSASASEILAGAIQDNDRGFVIGRRSFGKGLVQEGIQWPDGSAIRLTVARYYTPTGRSIQKSYEEGLDAYNNEAYERFNTGEMQSEDSVHFEDSLKYVTPGGKIVYGGGGIMPDVFIPVDTNGFSDYFGKLNYRGIFFQFSFEYVDKNRKELLGRYASAESFINRFNIDKKMISEFEKYAEEKGVEKDTAGLELSLSLIKNRIKATVGRNLFGEEVFYPVINELDTTIKEALSIINKKSLN